MLYGGHDVERCSDRCDVPAGRAQRSEDCFVVAIQFHLHPVACTHTAV